MAKVLDHGGYDLGESLAIVDGFPVSTAVVTKRGAGAAVTINHQAHTIGTAMPVLDTAQTNLFAATLSETITSTVARPIVAGSPAIYEISVTLQRAWAAGDLDAGAAVLPGSDQGKEP